jgi:hypothetical protein
MYYEVKKHDWGVASQMSGLRSRPKDGREKAIIAQGPAVLCFLVEQCAKFTPEGSAQKLLVDAYDSKQSMLYC